MDMWVKVFGPPELLVLDRGKEFFNEKFHAVLGDQGCGLHIDAESPWQNSRTERAGGILKEKILATAHAVSATPEELHLAIAEAVSARNRFMNRFGFSPTQRVFGKNLRLHGSMLTSDSMDQELPQASVTKPVRRLWEIQHIATKEWVRRQDQEAIRRSIRAKTRTSDMKSLAPGSWVYVFRDTPSYKGWTGRGVLIAEDLNNRSCWVSMRGRLWKASREQIRLAHPEEELGAELVVELSKEMLNKVHKPGQVAFQDVAQESFPQDDDMPGDEVQRIIRVTERITDPEAPPARSTTESTAPPSENLEMESEEANTTKPSEPSSRRVSFLEPPEESRPMEAIAEGDEPMSPSAPSRTEHTANDSFPRTNTEDKSAPDEVMLALSGPQTVRVDEGAHGTMSFGPLRTRRTQWDQVPETPPLGFQPNQTRSRQNPYPMTGTIPSLPTPAGSSTFLEVINFEQDDDMAGMGVAPKFIGVTWKHDREQGLPSTTSALSRNLQCLSGRSKLLPKGQALLPDQGQVLFWPGRICSPVRARKGGIQRGKEERAQHGWLLGFTDETLNKGASAPVAHAVEIKKVETQSRRACFVRRSHCPQPQRRSKDKMPFSRALDLLTSTLAADRS